MRSAPSPSGAPHSPAPRRRRTARALPRRRPRARCREQLTGDTGAKVKAAALKKVPGATVLRVESGGHGGAAYHARVRKPDGTEVVVLVNKDFEATSVEEMGRRG